MAKDRTKYQKAMRTGLAYNNAQRWQEAFGAFRVAIGEFPHEPAPYAGLGESCLGLKRLDRALECFKLAAKYSRGDITYMAKVADIQERQGQLNDAGRTYMAVGEILLKQRRLDEAIGNWQRAIRLDPGLLGAHRRLAMVFQRQHKIRDAVREYLAIARILQMQGEAKKAMQMAQAALRLDPGNEDVLKALELIQHGEAAFRDEEEEELQESSISEEEQAEADSLTETVRQMAAIFEAERSQQVEIMPSVDDPIAEARRLAQEQLAEEIFRDEEDSDLLPESGLSKLERDAALGQGMDFEARGQVAEAIKSYKKAIDGGLDLAAAYFTMGLLYLADEQAEQARGMFDLAATDPVYAEVGRLALNR
ncbi:MAG: tetratricopeptide repeat protein [Chloroflexi bacterium]|nr:tetratricopeptide repeat protein [Chloroflexota bacterium]